MKKLVSLCLALLLALTVLPPVTAGAASGYEQAVSLSSVALTDWMSAIRGETKITELTVPGTHDSCARKFANEDAFGITSRIAKCQSLNITEQLNQGVRYLDIRCEVDASTHSVKTVHGSVDCWNGNDYYYLDFLLQDVYNWLDAHPSESVFLMIKEDDGNVGAPTFTSAIYEYIHGYGQNKYFYGEDYRYQDYWYLAKAVPTLDDVRGKIVLFNRFDRYIASSGSTASEEESGQKIKYDDQESTSLTSPCYVTGEDWSSGAKYHVQDMYKLSTSDKLKAAQEMLSLGHYRGEYYLSFTSTTTSASIPNPQSYANTINPAFLNLTFDKGKPSGFIQMDFITEAAARKIVENNEAVSNLMTGTDGNITYELNRLTGTLTVSGSGAMNDYALDTSRGIKNTGTTAPWSDQAKNCLFDGQYNTDLITKIIVNDGVTRIGDYAFYGFDNVSSISLPDSVTAIGNNAIPDNVSTDYYSINVKAGNISREQANPFAGKTLSGVTLQYTVRCDTDNGWNNAIINFSTGRNADNRYFILMSNGTVLFNDGNGGAGGWNNCYFDLNTAAEINTVGQGWADITVTIYKDSAGLHYLDYYVNGVLKRTVALSEVCASGYPNGVSGSDGIFSFLSSPDIHLYYGATYNIYNMGGTADSYLDKASFYDYALSAAQLLPVYENTFTDSLGGTAVTGTVDNGNYVSHRTAENDGRSSTAYFPYSGTGASATNYVATGESPFAELDTSHGFAVSYWQRINGNYWDNRESLTFAQGAIGEMKYFTLGTDGYIRFNNGNGGSDTSLSSAGLYFDHTTANAAIRKQQWQLITVNILSDYAFQVYVNGVLTADVTVQGTAQYQSTGGLLSFLASPSTQLYLGSYTPYWGTATLSLDNVKCFCAALTETEAAALYRAECGALDAVLTNDFTAAPARVSGSVTWLDRFDGRDGVLYFPSGSADGDIAISVDGTVTTALSAVPAGAAITATYTGSGTVAQWLITTNAGTQTGSDRTYSFTLTDDTTVDVVLAVSVATDTTALAAAIALGSSYAEADYTAASYTVLANCLSDGEAAISSTSQRAVDDATEAILTAIYNLVPYLALNVSKDAGGAVSVRYDGLEDAASTGSFSVPFGTTVHLTATAATSNTFGGWYEIKTHRLLSTDATFDYVLSSNTDVKALFDPYGAAVLTFTYGNGYIAKRVSKTPADWKAVSSIAPLCPAVPYHYGGMNGSWGYDDSTVLASLTAGEHVNLTPVYTEQDVTEPALPAVTQGIPALTLTLALDEEALVGSYLMALSVPDGCEVVEKGIAFRYGKPDSFDPSELTLTLDNMTTTSKFNTAAHDGVYAVNVRRFTQYAWAARAYCTYYDGDGVLRVAYSDQVNCG